MSIRFGLNQTVNVFQEVFFGPSLTDQRREDLPGRNMQIAKEPERSVTNVFILAASEPTRLGKEIASDPFKSLDAQGNRIRCVRNNCCVVIYFVKRAEDLLAVLRNDFGSLAAPNTRKVCNAGNATGNFFNV